MIKFANSDSTIWNRDQLIIDIVYAMVQNLPRIEIGTTGEGPCAQSLGLYDLLDKLCQQFRYEPSNIYIFTCNLAESHDRYNIVIDPQVMYLKSAQQYMPINTNKKIQKHFGHFIGHGNLSRLCIGSFLYKNHRKRSLQTYHTKVTDSYHRPFIGIEDMMFNGHDWNEIHDAVELLRESPITIDQIDQYPILNPTTLNITKVYPEFFVEIVNLTYWSGNTFYIDEKIWRPMLMRTPFIVYGPQNFLPRLRALGFRTFDSWWDEGYSEDSPNCQIDAIKHIIDFLALKNISYIESMYADMQLVLEHNYQLMKQIKKQDLHV